MAARAVQARRPTCSIQKPGFFGAEQQLLLELVLLMTATALSMAVGSICWRLRMLMASPSWCPPARPAGRAGWS
jgi:hypothetical protein